MIKCIAIDDEPLALKQISSYIDKTPFLELTQSFSSAIDALSTIKTEEVDLLFVDINMPDLNGLDFVKSLKTPPKIIFTTAYEQYALEGFKVDAIDYLLKPISYPEFLKAAQKAKEWFELTSAKNDTVASNNEFLFIKSEYRILRIDYKNIKYIEGMKEYVRIHLTNDKPVMTLLSMKKLSEQLPNEMFMRVHKSYIVNLKQITTIERSRIVFDNNVYIPVSDQYKNDFQHYIDNYFL